MNTHTHTYVNTHLHSLSLSLSLSLYIYMYIRECVNYSETKRETDVRKPKDRYLILILTLSGYWHWSSLVHTHTNSQTYVHYICVYIYIYIYVCICVCVCERRESEWDVYVHRDRYLILIWLFCQAPSISLDSETYVVPSISFQPFFVQAFKFVIDSWKFSVLLLYILWDDWPIFMSSGSNEQLQQELEYTLLKPDYHSWWISKMKSGCEDTLKEWYAIKFCFKLGKNTTETYGILQTTFGLSCMNQASVFGWHKRFKEGRESVMDDEMCGRSKEVNTQELIDQRVRIRVTMLGF